MSGVNPVIDKSHIFESYDISARKHPRRFSIRNAGNKTLTLTTETSIDRLSPSPDNRTF
jgi:hypothetical protein